MDKMTNVKAINYVLDNCTLPADVKEKLMNMQASLSKKSAGNKKPTAKQSANSALMDVLAVKMETNRLYAISEIAHEIFHDEYSTQKISALLKQMVDAGRVTRTEEKRKPYFTVVTLNIDEEDEDEG